jgi:hypothetical protein
MKTVKYILVLIGMAILFTTELKAQSTVDKSNHIAPNTNYKDQIPVSKGNKFQDSFKNDRMEDLSEGNYKQQQPKKKSPKSSVRQNFNTSKRIDNSSSKHPYGL